MNSNLVKKYAEVLEKQLSKYSKMDSEAQKLSASLDELISKAKNRQIYSPIEYQKVPGGYWFNEGNLRKYPELEEAYSEFKLEVTGGETDEAKDLLKIIAGFQSNP